jgi:hypothetical protein
VPLAPTLTGTLDAHSTAAMRRLLITPSSLPIQSQDCHGNATLVDISSLPPTLDARVQWPDLFHASPNPPTYCDPVAFVVATIFDDVTSIALNTKLTFSVQEIISCANYQCDAGGWPNNAFLYMVEKGLPSEACYPLSSSEISQARTPSQRSGYISLSSVVTHLCSAQPVALMAAPKLQARAG